MQPALTHRWSKPLHKDTCRCASHSQSPSHRSCPQPCSREARGPSRWVTLQNRAGWVRRNARDLRRQTESDSLFLRTRKWPAGRGREKRHTERRHLSTVRCQHCNKASSTFCRVREATFLPEPWLFRFPRFLLWFFSSLLYSICLPIFELETNQIYDSHHLVPLNLVSPEHRRGHGQGPRPCWRTPAGTC